MNHARKPLIGLIALGAALAMPLAFAQSEPTDTMGQDAAATTQTQTDPTQEQPTQPTTAPTTGTETPQQLTWADVDSDKNGSISKTESAQLSSLAQVFEEADANADGELTADEYKAYVAKVNAAGADSGGSD